MATISDADKALLEKVNGLLQETPKIDAALKNYYAITLAKAQTAVAGTKVGIAALPAGIVLDMIRALSISINAVTLLEPTAFSAKYPQPEDELALRRIEHISNYRALHMASNTMARKSPGSKHTKTFGVSFLKTKGVLEGIAAAVKTSLSKKREGAAAETDVDEFLKIFVETVDSTKSYFQKSAWYPSTGTGKPRAGTQAASPNGDEVGEYADEWASLVWSNNWQAELSRRREARADAAKARAAQVEKDTEEYAEYLKSVVVANENRNGDGEGETDSKVKAVGTLKTMPGKA
jgi:hypothetical protein